MLEPNFTEIYQEEIHPEELSLIETERIYWFNYWGDIARIALQRFPEFQREESILLKEIKN